MTRTTTSAAGSPSAERGAAALLLSATLLAAAPAAAALVELWLALGRWLYPAALAAATALAIHRLRRAPAAAQGGLIVPAEAVYGAGLLLLAFGSRSGSWHLAWAGFPLLALGGAGLVGGEGAARRLLPAALLLLVALPHPNPPTYEAITAGKSAMGQAAARILALTGVPAQLDGWSLRIGPREVRLVDACSGLRTQVGLLALAGLLIAWQVRSRAGQLATLLACTPAAFLASSVRTALVARFRGDPRVPEGWADAIHDVSGLLVIVPAVLLVYAAGRTGDLLREEALRAGAQRPSASAAVPPPAGGPPRLRALFVASAVAAAAAAAAGAPTPPRARQPPGLPASLDGLAGRSAADEAALQGTLGVARVEVREYGPAPDGGTALLAHHHALDVPATVFDHAPETCHLVAGWTPVRTERLNLGRHDVLRLELARGDGRRLAHVVYLAPERPGEASLLGAWLHATWDGALGRSTAGSLLVLSSVDLPQVTEPLRRREVRRMTLLLEHVAGGSVTGGSRSAAARASF